jgi:hypothetical protein
MKYPELLKQNVYSKHFKDSFLVIGTCLEDMQPEVVAAFKKKYKNIITICLEVLHYNQYVAKLFDIIALGNTKKVAFLTPDGSPHCVQVHYASKYLKRGLKKSIEFEHFVVNGKGEVFQVDVKDIDKSRDFALPSNKLKLK